MADEFGKSVEFPQVSEFAGASENYIDSPEFPACPDEFAFPGTTDTSDKRSRGKMGLLYYAAVASALFMVVNVTNGFNNRQFKEFVHMPHMVLRQIYERADNGDTGSAHFCNRMKGAEPSFMEKGHQKRLDRVLPVMTERKFVEAEFNARIGKHSPAHFCTQCARILFFSVIKNNLTDLRSFDQIRYIERFTKSGYSGEIRIADSVVNRNSTKGKINMCEFPV